MPTSEQIAKLITPSLQVLTVDPKATVTFKDNEFYATIHGVRFKAGLITDESFSFFRCDDDQYDEYETIGDHITITIPPWNVTEKEWETGEFIYPV